MPRPLAALLALVVTPAIAAAQGTTPGAATTTPASTAAPTSTTPNARPVIACEGNERNLGTYQRMHQVLFRERDGSRVAEFYAPQVLSHDLDSGGGQPHLVDRSGLAAMWANSRRTNPDRVIEDDLIICQGPYVIVRSSVHSIDRAGFGGQPPTGKPYAITAIDIYRLEQDRVVERWGNVDMLGMLRQLGYSFVAPAGPAAPASRPDTTYQQAVPASGVDSSSAGSPRPGGGMGW